MTPLDLPRSGARAWGADRDGGTRRHNGVDFMAGVGTPVYAAAAGRVRWATTEYTPGFAGYGRVVSIDAGDGTHHLYAHLAAPRVLVGQHVDAGQLIGTAGRTQYRSEDPTDAQRTMGAHLHWEVAAAAYPMGSNAPRLDPLAYLERTNAYHPIARVRLGGELPVANVESPPVVSQIEAAQAPVAPAAVQLNSPRRGGLFAFLGSTLFGLILLLKRKRR